MSYKHITDLEKALCDFTGAPYVVLTDCCTHAIEMCLRLTQTKVVKSSCWTYLSVPMTYKKLGIDFELIEESWSGEYKIHGTRIWDSARLLAPGMYRKGNAQCLSFGNGKPVDNKRGGAILCDNEQFYHAAKQMGSDGRDMQLQSWISQRYFKVGYHYNMPFEHAEQILSKLQSYIDAGNYDPVDVQYPDCRQVKFLD